jgi:hypothetical protein
VGIPLRARLSARLRSPWLDGELAEGIVSWRSAAHAARALQLTSDRHRRRLADSLDRLPRDAEQGRGRAGAAIRPCPEQVRDALPELLGLAARLRAGAPVAVGGVARLHRLLADGGGPCYTRGKRAELRRALQEVMERLEVRD